MRSYFLIVIRTVWFWTSVFFITTICFLSIAIKRLLTPSTREVELSKFAHGIACLWGELIIKLTPGWKVQIRGLQYIEQAKSNAFIIIANHQSAADIFALFTTWLQFRWLSKASVFSLPMVGQCMRWAGYVPVERGDHKSHKKALDKSRYWVEQNVSMLFFPEGSRSKDGVLKPFKTGAFRLSIDTGVAILPIVIEGTKKMISKHSIIPNPSEVLISALPPVQANPNESLDHFIVRARAQMEQELNYLTAQVYHTEAQGLENEQRLHFR